MMNKNAYDFEYEYEEFPFLNVPRPSQKEEYEVTDYSIDLIQELYPEYKDKKRWIKEQCRKPRAQMSTRGAWLRRNTCGNEPYINVVADILTSSKRIYEKTEEELSDAERVFRRIYHSCGNILPVCEGINTRWGSPDTALHKLEIIREHLTNKWYNKKALDTLDTVRNKIKNGETLGTKISDRGCLKYWIAQEYGQTLWKTFIENNYLQDYVRDINSDDPELITINENDEDGMIKEYNRLIISRGYRIYNKKTITEEILNEILDEIRKNLSSTE